MTQLDLLTETRPTARLTHVPPNGDGWPEPWGCNWLNPIWRPFDPALFAAIRRELAEGPRDWPHMHQALVDENGYWALKGHVAHLIANGEVEERKRYWGAPNLHDRGYRGWVAEYR
ncbi:MAG: hypothetical protein U5L08_04275, partial [Xanthomonadales bacterium]|nr:hypothetical protein [Xanthomonadales bacterium]